MSPLFRLRRRTRIAARHLARSTRGAVMLEMAFAIPFLVLVGFGGLEIANLTLAWSACRCTANMSARSMRWSRSEEHTSELQSLMRISYAVFCLKKKTY